jgi:hypothetical protein
MLLKRIWRVVRSGGDQQIGRRHRCRRLEMMLEKPDLIDADAFGQLDLFELAPEHLRMRRIFARGGGRPDGESHRLILPRFKRARAAPCCRMVLSAAGSVNRLDHPSAAAAYRRA